MLAACLPLKRRNISLLHKLLAAEIPLWWYFEMYLKCNEGNGSGHIPDKEEMEQKCSPQIELPVTISSSSSFFPHLVTFTRSAYNVRYEDEGDKQRDCHQNGFFSLFFPPSLAKGGATSTIQITIHQRQYKKYKKSQKMHKYQGKTQIHENTKRCNKYKNTGSRKWRNEQACKIQITIQTERNLDPNFPFLPSLEPVMEQSLKITIHHKRGSLESVTSDTSLKWCWETMAVVQSNRQKGDYLKKCATHVNWGKKK